MVGPRAVEAHCEHPGDMQRCTVRAILDLVPARGTVGDDQGTGIGAAHRRQQRQLGHFDRSLIGVCAVAERAGHAAATGFDGFDTEIGNETKYLFDRLECAERFLMAVAVNQRFARHGAERQFQAAGFRLANQKFLEQQCVRADALGFVVRAEREQFVAKRQETARLQIRRSARRAPRTARRS